MPWGWLHVTGHEHAPCVRDVVSPANAESPGRSGCCVICPITIRRLGAPGKFGLPLLYSWAGRESIAFCSIDRQDSHTVSSFRDVCAMTVLSDTTSSSRPNDPASILEHFAALPDPRREQGRIHELDAIVFLSICAVLCGANSWQQIADYAASKRDWLKTFLILREG